MRAHFCSSAKLYNCIIAQLFYLVLISWCFFIYIQVHKYQKLYQTYQNTLQCCTANPKTHKKFKIGQLQIYLYHHQVVIWQNGWHRQHTVQQETSSVCFTPKDQCTLSKSAPLKGLHLFRQQKVHSLLDSIFYHLTWLFIWGAVLVIHLHELSS